MFTGFYSNPGLADSTPFIDNWPPASSDPLQQKADALLDFCYPNASILAPASNEYYSYEALKGILTPENINHLLREYKHFHVHWPLIHTPTFDPIAAWEGLVLAMCCVGAVYSDRMAPKSVRWLIELTRSVVLRTSQIYKMSQNHQQVLDPNRHCPTDIEEFEALSLLHSLFLWHGSQQQRQQAREEFFVLANITRRAGFLQPLPRSNPGFSSLHEPGPITGDEVASWNWTAWVENEKRVRAMAYIFLIDAASTIFFNGQPQFDVNEIRVSLPADDAAWEAKTEEECASALGLRGEVAQVANASGSRRAKQLSMSEALQVLYRGQQGQVPERSTNAFGKFRKSLPVTAMPLGSTDTLSPHPCHPCSDLQHSTPTAQTHVYKRQQYSGRAGHSAQWCQRTSATAPPIDRSSSRVVEDMLGRRPGHTIPSITTSSGLLQRWSPLLFPRSSVLEKLKKRRMGCTCRPPL